MENMNREICEYYVPTNKISNKLCRYFIGRKDNKYDLGKCRYNCSILESKNMMQDGQVLERRRGALRRK